ncbi:FtsX-like permease family protein [Yinghuangia soli]|uniref:ABC transporter permease n=1 Tax=Yinghuangia soli TaxID=2908204 RepID=A0AA41PWT3_9ACTN|nr:ABC transporter permease [Yinghuangia soli]MCF2527017.1 ABC transporter permease [Yinghuangia soli]
MFLALLEIRAARGRFLLMGSVVMLVAALVGIVSGFTTGLGNDTVSALRGLPATHFAFSADAKSDQFNRSLVDDRTLRAWRDRLGGDAAPVGVSITRGTTDRGVDIDLAAFGIEPGSFLAPPVSSGAPVGSSGGSSVGSSGDGVVISKKIADKGVRVGDTVTIDRFGITMRVAGITGARSYGHVPAAYLPLELWQRIRFAVPGADPGAEAPRQFSAVALRTGGADVSLAEMDAALGTKTVSREGAFEAAPGYSGERITMTSIQVFLFLIAPLVVGAFFSVWTVQRTPELALLRALGASRPRLLWHSTVQAAVVVAAGAACGGLVALGVGAALGDAVPFSLPASTLAATMAAVAGVGLAGTALTLRRVTSADPLTMLGAHR